MTTFVKPCDWGTFCPETWAQILLLISRGESFGIWNGRFREMPWPTGRCALRVKVGKKRKLVLGTLSEEYEGFDGGGEIYSLIFTPNRPRVFSRVDKLNSDN